MKLVSINRSGFPALAILREDTDGSRILPVVSAMADMVSPVSMNDVLQDWSYWQARLAELPGEARPQDWVPVAEVEILAPVPYPRSLICIGLNYKDHARETGAEIPTEPVIFAKHPSCVTGPGSDIVLPEASRQVDYEAELAVVIGQQVFQANEEEARAAIAGFTIMNDVSARDWQGRTSQWMPAKSFPTFGPMGPLMVTADELGDAGNLRISLSVNGETLQDSSTGQLIFGVVEIVRHLSSIWPLAPGDVIATGTPAGVGFTRTPARFMQAGDTVEITIEGIGTLRNPVTDNTGAAVAVGAHSAGSGARS